PRPNPADPEMPSDDRTDRHGGGRPRPSRHRLSGPLVPGAAAAPGPVPLHGLLGERPEAGRDRAGPACSGGIHRPAPLSPRHRSARPGDAPPPPLPAPAPRAAGAPPDPLLPAARALPVPLRPGRR